jgi:hypothetical protein
MQRYHVYLGDKRTTVSLSDKLAAFLALKLHLEPETNEAHTSIREWLQARLDEDNDPGRYRISQWLQGVVMEHLVDKKLSKQYDDWIIGE